MNILFDLDGTLTDPGEGYLNSVHYAFQTLGLAAPLDADILACLGPPTAIGFRSMLGEAQQALIPEAVRLYRERYKETGLFENEVYPGIPALLAKLAGQGNRLFLATSKPIPFAKRIVEHFGLDVHFTGLHGSELDGTRAAKADVIAYVLEQHGLNPHECVMIGDRLYDVEGAQAHGIMPIGVLWGYGSRSELETAGAEYTVASPDELFTVLMSIA